MKNQLNISITIKHENDREIDKKNYSQYIHVKTGGVSTFNVFYYKVVISEYFSESCCMLFSWHAFIGHISRIARNELSNLIFHG